MRTVIAIATFSTLAHIGCGRGHAREGDGQGGARSTMIRNKGSDTMVNLAQALAEAYHDVRPEFAVAVSGGGSGTGIAALENGTVELASSSREIKPQEAATTRRNTGKTAVEHVIAYDALSVYVHRSNPIAKITKAQIASIYGEHGTARRWSDVGVEVPGCAGQEIVRVSRQNNSGTYQYFREWALGDGDFRLGSRDMQGSKDVVDLVEQTPCAIGYSGVGYRTPRVKALCIAMDDASACVDPTPANTLAQTYPISRGLYMYTLGNPTGELARYLDWIRSDAGQAIVERSGFVPLPADRRRPAPSP